MRSPGELNCRQLDHTSRTSSRSCSGVAYSPSFSRSAEVGRGTSLDARPATPHGVQSMGRLHPPACLPSQAPHAAKNAPPAIHPRWYPGPSAAQPLWGSRESRGHPLGHQTRHPHQPTTVGSPGCCPRPPMPAQCSWVRVGSRHQIPDLVRTEQCMQCTRRWIAPPNNAVRQAALRTRREGGFCCLLRGLSPPYPLHTQRQKSMLRDAQSNQLVEAGWNKLLVS